MALTREDVTKLYVASFNRAPDAAGLSYWMNDSVITNLEDMAAAFMESAEMTLLYPAGQTNTEFVQSMYLNMFGRSADTSGLAYWVERLDDGTLPRESMIQTLINGAIAGTGSASDRAVLNNKTTVGLAYADAGLNDIADATAVMAGVTATDLSVTVALSSIVALQTEVAAAAAAEAAAAAAAAAAAVAAAAASAAAIAAAAAAAAAAAEDAGYTFTLTTGIDTFTGGTGPDTFNGTYDAGVATDTFGFGGNDILDGGAGIDRLNISHLIDTAMTPPDALWTDISNIEEVVFTTTGAGAQTITTGVEFDAAFAAGGVDFTTTTSGAGAITLNMSTFTGAADITTVSTDGAQIITAGSGVSTVNATSGAGALTISGANLTQVDAVTTGAGAQMITSTGASNVVVNATSNSGATTIVTGAGNDTITLVGSSAGGANSITTGAGADSITLYTNFSSVDTITIGASDSKVMTANTTTGLIAAGQTITFGNGLDTITNFNAAVDVLNVGTGGAAVTGVGLDEAAFTATKTIFFSGAYAGGVFTIAGDGLGADTLLLDTTVLADQNIATADTWVLLVGVDSDTLVPASFI